MTLEGRQMVSQRPGQSRMVSWRPPGQQVLLPRIPKLQNPPLQIFPGNLNPRNPHLLQLVADGEPTTRLAPTTPMEIRLDWVVQDLDRAEMIQAILLGETQGLSVEEGRLAVEWRKRLQLHCFQRRRECSCFSIAIMRSRVHGEAARWSDDIAISFGY